MKISWGTGIALVYGVFALSMIGIVLASRKHDPGLVEKDYYNLDLNYQAHMDKKENTAQLAVKPVATFDAATHTVVLQFPEGMKVTGGNGKFFRAVTVNDDFKVDLITDELGRIAVPAAKMAPGRWHVELDWEAGGKKYFYETAVFVTNA